MASTAVRVGSEQAITAFAPGLEPVLEVEPGTVVTFETSDAFDGQIASEDDLVPGIDRARLNRATGPVAVRGAEPGDSLVAEILDVRPGPRGVATATPAFGPLGRLLGDSVTRVFDVGPDGIRMGGRVCLPLRPMIGVIGVAPADGEVSTRLAGPHGGNLDERLNAAGATVLLPVRRPGGLLALGDLHASMGDGEICFSGVEVAGEVDVRLGLLAGKQARWPVTDVAGAWVPHATADAVEDALDLAVEEAACLLVDEWGFSVEDAAVFLSCACDVGVTQACRPAPLPNAVARVRIPKVDACPAPFAP